MKLLTVLAAGAMLAGCGSDGPAASRTTTSTTTERPAARSTVAPDPSPYDAAAAKAICAEPLYANAFASVSECEATMIDPKAVAELKAQIENYAQP